MIHISGRKRALDRTVGKAKEASRHRGKKQQIVRKRWAGGERTTRVVESKEGRKGLRGTINLF